MCGIIGIVGKESVTTRLLEGLSRLEYRGYDSAGIAVVEPKEGKLEVRREKGKLKALQDLVANSPIHGNLGIGHTRWATHGAPTQVNAHPHSNSHVCVVHNGIIENHALLKERLMALGYSFESQTDTETLVHLMTEHLKTHRNPLDAFRSVLGEIEGAFAIAILVKDHHDLLLVARQGSPLVIGRGEEENLIGSDAIALAPWVSELQYLEDGDYAQITRTSIEIYDCNHQSVNRPIKKTQFTSEAAAKGSFDHFMLKEIFEQPHTVKKTLESFMGENGDKTASSSTTVDWANISHLTIVACGTAYMAASIAKYWFEMIAHLRVEIDIASEYRYRQVPYTRGAKEAAIFISQSGETIDTLMALNLAKEKGLKTIGLINTPESSIARQADHALYTLAGPEIGVASTKAFTAQLAALASLVLEAAKLRGCITEQQAQTMRQDLLSLPKLIETVLRQDEQFQKIAHQIKDAKDVLYIGRGTNHPLAMEGALKLKEISYIHAEGFAAGELKHGPIALVDTIVPVIVVAPNDSWMTKTLSNMQEVIARGAKTICLTDHQGRQKIEADKMETTIIELPASTPLTAPILYAIPLQFIAYYTAAVRGLDVDQPRNLAKSVTVE